MDEIWAPIPGQEGCEVSTAGRVRSHTGRVLKPSMSARYPRVMLRGRKWHSVHRLVAAAFIGPANGRYVNHKDGVKTNSRLENLEYCTQSENMKHAFRMGLQSNTGERHSRAKLTDEKVLEIRRLISAGRTQTEVAQMMHVHQTAISRANSGKRWSHLSAPAAAGA